jgi:hypothetical protein
VAGSAKPRPPTDRPRPRTPKDDPKQIVLGAGVASGILGVAILAFAFQPSGPGMSALGTGVAVAGGALAVGGFLGLLFGIPRALQQQQPPPSDKPAGDAPSATAPRAPTARTPT